MFLNTMNIQATVVVERSNSFNSNIDWIVHGSIDGSRPHVGDSFSGLRMRNLEFSIVNGLHINRRIHSFINIYTDNRHKTLQIGL